MCNWATATQRNAAADTQLVWHVAVKSLSLHSHSHTHTPLPQLPDTRADWCLVLRLHFVLTSKSVLLCAGNVSKNVYYKLQLMTSLQSNGETGDGLLDGALWTSVATRGGNQAVLSGRRRTNLHKFCLYNVRYKTLAAVSSVMRRHVFG